MKYSIQHVLEGMQLSQQNRVKELHEQVQQQAKTLVEKRSARIDNGQRVRNTLQDLARAIHHGEGAFQEGVGYHDLDDAFGELRKLVQGVPSAYELSTTADRLGKLQDALDRAEHEQANPELEAFLKAIQLGGETHVSGHGLKQAGFNPAELTHYVTAYAAAQPAKEA